MALLEVKNLEVGYGRGWSGQLGPTGVGLALQDISLEVDEGTILAVLGRNGAGKSSLMKAIAGDVRPSGGHILWDGQEITKKAAHQRVRSGIALVPEGRRIFPHLTVDENLRLGGFYLGKSEFKATRARILDLFPVLAERIDAPAGQFSGGQQQMLAVGRALMSGAKLLLLDEPSLGLAPLVADEVYGRLKHLHEQGLTLIIVEQQVQRVLSMADAAIVLSLGKIVLQEDPEVLADDPRLIAVYMGQVGE